MIVLDISLVIHKGENGENGEKDAKTVNMADEIARLLNSSLADKKKLTELLQDYLDLNDE